MLKYCFYSLAPVWAYLRTPPPLNVLVSSTVVFKHYNNYEMKLVPLNNLNMITDKKVGNVHANWPTKQVSNCPKQKYRFVLLCKGSTYYKLIYFRPYYGL